MPSINIKRFSSSLLRSQYFLSLASALILLVITFFFFSSIQGVEEKLVEWRYAMRGEVQADTNIVLLYFDSEDISALGGWPLRRNYYALLIEILTKLEVEAIGIDIFLGTKSREFPEYDLLLTSVLEKSKNVVLSSYYRAVSPSDQRVGPRSTKATEASVVWRGEGYQQPFDGLAQAARGVGHTNLLEGSNQKVPVFISDGITISSSFFLELARARFDGEIPESDSAVGISTSLPPGSVDFPISSDGTLWINFLGSLKSFRSYRAVEVIRGFEFERHGIEPSIDLDTFRGKIVLIGVIAEGFGNFFKTPFSNTFPAVGIHATLLDNALQGRFLSNFGRVSSFFISLSLFFVGIVLFRMGGESRGVYFVIGILVAYVLISQICFSLFNLVFPVVQPALVLVLPLLIVHVIEHRIIQTMVKRLSSEKSSVESELREKELQLSLLEHELLEGEQVDPSGSSSDLRDRVKRIKEDIRTLSKEVNDLATYQIPPELGKSGEEIYERIVYDRASKMSDVVSMIEKIANSNANILILGESGTGKELVANAIHRRSTRRNGPFVAVNCGALTETLLESELFGHERGSFTGAVKDKPGRFELANNGTILLDEIAETSSAFQVKLLRVIQEGEFERVGSTKTMKVDVRIIAATNKDIRRLIEEKKFREDLYYRLNVFSIDLPPLRERKPDVAVLTERFLKNEDPTLSVSETVMEVLRNYGWPGNVRELEMAIKRASILARSEQRSLLRLKDFPSDIQQAAKSFIELDDKILESLRAKEFSHSSISETANELGGLNRGTVSEYFRGLSFRSFFVHNWDLDAAARDIAGTTDEVIIDRVRKKLNDYLENVTQPIDRQKQFDEARPLLKQKYKNLPQKYHSFLDEVIRSYIDGKWG